MVSSQDEHVGRAGGTDLKQLLAHRVGRPLVPVGSVHGLLGGPNLNPAGMEGVKLVSLGNMAVEGDRIELGEHGDAVNAGVDAVGNGDIDQAVLTGHGHSWLGALLGKRIEAAAAP